MPNYDFQCECGRVVTENFNFNDDKTVTCECGAQMKRVYGTFGIVLKGTGWGKDK